jgi:tetratricopeptide (TPR) repeat protein
MAPVGLLAVSGGLAAGLVLAIVLAGAGATWLVARLGPERRLQAVRRRLDRGDHRAALELVRRLRPKPAGPPQPWHGEQRFLEGECLYAASEAALRERHFADALDHYRAAASLLGLSEAEATRRVVEAMLAEARRLSAADPDSPALPELLALILERQPACPEASFWLALHQLRRGDTAAVATLEAIHGATQGRQVDAALYLGGVWLRDGRPRDALRVLADANRLAPHCPLISWQLGTALLAAGGDALLGVRALQKATAADGLPKYRHEPHRLWADTLPADSWVRNLAQRAGTLRAAFRCPLGLDQIESILQSARLDLAEALEVCGRADEAVPLFTDLLKSHDVLPVRRGLGLALAQLEHYDEALPHLRKAHSQEQPPEPRTVGPLALCLARASGDRVGNVRRALALLSSLKVRADAIWARQAGAVFAAAQAVGVAVAPDQIEELADVLASTGAADPTAAAVYDLLAGARPDAVTAECAWLYARAAQRHGVRLTQDEALFDRAMRDRAGCRAFFDAHEWDFDAAERLYLERWAEHHPGSFPTAPGPGYAAEAEASLLADSRRQETQSRLDAADAVARLALRLALNSAAVHDRLAELAFRRGDLDAATDWLKTWRRLHPADPRPHARLAVLAYRQHLPDKALSRLRKALDRTRGPDRAPLAFLGARFALAGGHNEDAALLLDECLTFDADHPGALACRVALAWAADDFPTLAKLAGRLAAVRAEDPWFRYLTAASLFLSGQLQAAEEVTRQTAFDSATAADGQHLLALLRLRQGDAAGAAEALKRATGAAGGTAHDHAYALRGQAAWRAGDYGEAVRCWQALPAARLTAWHLDEVLPGTAFLAGLQALRAGQPDEAAKWLRQAAQLGHPDPRLDPLLTDACLRAGTRPDAPNRVIAQLEKVLATGGPRPEVVRRLSRAYRRQHRLADARRLLDRAPADDPALALERGLVSLAENQLLPAEQAFAEAFRHDPQSPAACLNLVFTRLSLGRLAGAAELLPRAAEMAPRPSQQRLLAQLRVLASGEAAAVGADWTTEDDKALVQCLRGIGRLEAVEPLFDALQAARPRSPAVRQAQAELLPLRAKLRIDRGDAAAARKILKAHPGPRPPLVHNLLGVCACLRQDFDGAVRHFQAALPLGGDDVRVQQNLAVVRGWMGDVGRAAAHWQRFLELHTAQAPRPTGVADYHRLIGALVKEKLKEPTSTLA